MGSKKMAFPIENPFTIKFGQVFTGFGIGCGVGIGVGRPIYLGAIPAMQQVMTAARGATDAFSGVGRHVNGSLRKLGVKNVEAGIGCGVGIGHGFGVGIALKPGVVRDIQNSFGQMLENVMMKLGDVPGLSSVQNVIPVSAQSTAGPAGMLTATPSKIPQVSSGNVPIETKAAESTFQHTRNDDSSHEETMNSSHKLQTLLPERPTATRTEKVINDFLRDPLFKVDDTEQKKVDRNVRSENIVLQMLLKHQHIIEELREENRKLQEILVEDLKVPISKIQSKIDSRSKSYYPCSNCFECRRRTRKSAR